MAAISGVMRSATSLVTTAPNAAPMTTATARSTTLPRMTKSLNPLSIVPPSDLPSWSEVTSGQPAGGRPRGMLGRRQHDCEQMRPDVAGHDDRRRPAQREHDLRATAVFVP